MCFPKYERRSSLLPGYKIRQEFPTYCTHLFFVNNNRLGDYERTFSSTYETPTDMCFPTYERRSSLLPGYKIRREFPTYCTQLFFVNNNWLNKIETAYPRFLPLSRPISRKIRSPLLIAPHLQSRISVSNWPRRLSNKTISNFITVIDSSYLRPSLHTKPPGADKKPPVYQNLIDTYTAHLCSSSFYVPDFFSVTPSFSTIDFSTYSSSHM